MTKIGSLERLASNTCYTLAIEILENYESKGFQIHREDDLIKLLEVNELASKLTELGDIRGSEIKIKSHKLVKYYRGLKIVK